ncbi:MAG: hypothetical protein ABIN25_05855 [Ginsengibacter sp.]
MTYRFLFTAFIFVACNKPPALAPATPETYWIDSGTLSDTIITNVNGNFPVIYLAKKNWHQLADTNFTHGFKFIAISYRDSILVKPLGDASTNYKGPFILSANERNDTLRAQNFLDTVNTNPVNIYIRLY